MIRNIFSIDTNEKDIKFVANRETGKWVLTNQRISEVKDRISSPFVQRRLEGSNDIAINMGRACNFNCVYCLVGSLKEEKSQLELDVGLKTIDRICEMHQDKKELVFHGSEPMVYFDMIKELILYGKMKKAKIQFSMQSNGSLLTQEKTSFLLENHVGIGISFDGLPEHQNINRPYKNGNRTYDDVVRNINMIIRQNQKASIVTVVTKNNVCDLEKIIYSYKNQGISGISFNPVNPTKDFELSPKISDLIISMQNIFDNYLEKLMKGEDEVTLLNFRRYLGIFFNQKTTSSCINCGAGPMNPLLAVDIDGSIYPCDYFWNNDSFKIGTIFEMRLDEAAKSEKNFRNYRHIDDINECDICDWKRFCGGGCPGGNVALGKTIYQPYLYCEYNKAMLIYMAKNLPLIYSRGLIKKILS